MKTNMMLVCLLALTWGPSVTLLHASEISNYHDKESKTWHGKDAKTWHGKDAKTWQGKDAKTWQGKDAKTWQGKKHMEKYGRKRRLKFRGDFRYRYQYEKTENDATARDRQRLQFRYGVKAKVNKEATIAAGLATGGADLNSTNQTMGGNFTTKGIQLDYAYLTWTPTFIPGAKAMYGKMKNPIYRASDLMWDGDIRPEGVAASYKLTEGATVAAGYFVLDEDKTTALFADDALIFGQGVYSMKVSAEMSVKAAVSAYKIGGGSVSESSSDFNILGGSLSVTQKVKGLGQITGFADVVNNVSAADSAEGLSFLVGAKVGDKKVKKAGQWQLKGLYRDLKSESIPMGDVSAGKFASGDSDFYGGETAARGLEFVAKYGVSKNVTFALDIYSTQPRTGGNNELLVQADLSAKF